LFLPKLPLGYYCHLFGSVHAASRKFEPSVYATFFQIMFFLQDFGLVFMFAPKLSGALLVLLCVRDVT
jgi:hypothetical protein